MGLPGVDFTLCGGCEPGVLKRVEEFGVEDGFEDAEFERASNACMVPERLEFVEGLGGKAEAFA